MSTPEEKLQFYKTLTYSIPIVATIVGSLLGLIYYVKADNLKNKIEEQRKSNEALKVKTLALVQELREFIHRRQSEFNLISMTRPNISKDESINFKQLTDNMSSHSAMTTEEYNRRFKVRALLVLEQLKERLPENFKSIVKHEHDAYTFPVNFFGYNDVADDLEKRAESLQVTPLTE